MFQHYILTMVAILSFNTKAGLVATASRARGETTSRARGVITELSPAAGLRELVPRVRSHSNGVRARGDSCDGAPRGRGHRDGIRRAGSAMIYDDVPKCRVGGAVGNDIHTRKQGINRQKRVKKRVREGIVRTVLGDTGIKVKVGL